METLARRTLLAERHSAKRLAAKASIQAAHQRVATRRQSIEATREFLDQRKQAILLSKALWKKGPLAPNLEDVPMYGVVSHPLRLDNSQVAVREEIVKERCEWAGGVKFLSLAVGDRVVFVEGPWKGRIDTIQEIVAETGSVRLTNTKMRSRVPEFIENLYKHEPSFSPLNDNHPAIPISAIRLVHPLTSAATGITRDVIIRRLLVQNIRRDSLTGTTEWDRVIPGPNVIIPFPKPEPPSYPIHLADTTRENVSAETFVPTLLRPPMPKGIIDELRGKYSKFRTRHEKWYVEKKEAEMAAKKVRRAAISSTAPVPASMLDPNMEASRVRKEERRARGQPELSEEMLGKIGEVMAKNQMAMCEAAGLKKESTLGSQ